MSLPPFLGVGHGKWTWAGMLGGHSDWEVPGGWGSGLVIATAQDGPAQYCLTQNAMKGNSQKTFSVHVITTIMFKSWLESSSSSDAAQLVVKRLLWNLGSAPTGSVTTAKLGHPFSVPSSAK